MAEYYTQGIRRTKRRRTTKRRSGREWALLLLDIAVAIVMAVLLFATLTTVVVQYISPARTGVLSVLALVAPVVYLLDVVVLLYWVARWRWRFAVVALVPVVVGLFYVSRHYRADIMRDHDTKYIERRFTKVLTYNVREGRNEGLVDTILTIRPDIICLQEIATNSDNWKGLAERYNTTHRDGDDSSNQILSRYRIVKSGLIDTLPRNRALWADLRIDKDTVRVISLHLRSTAIRKEDTQFLENHEYILDNERKTKLHSIVSRASRGGVEVCGFDEAPCDFVWRLQRCATILHLLYYKQRVEGYILGDGRWLCLYLRHNIRVVAYRQYIRFALDRGHLL